MLSRVKLIFHQMKFTDGNLYYMKSNTNKLGTWIREGLNELGKNQAWLADKIGVQAPQVSRIISGASEATPDLLSAIADALGKPRAQAYRAAGYLNQESPKDEWVEEMTYKLNKLSPAMRGVAERFINSMVEGQEADQPKTKTKQRSSTL